MKKIIILTASTGGGHNKVANTIKQYLSDAAYEVEIIDFLKIQNKIYEIIVSHGYEILATKFPKLYGELYKMSNVHRLNPSVLNAIRRSEKIYMMKVVKELEPDLIITTHPFAAAVIGALRENGDITMPMISIVTDFIAHKSYVSQGIDAYIVGSMFTKQKLSAQGIDTNRIHDIGIPVSKEFYSKTAPKNDRFTVLVMGGSMGLDQMEEVIENLVLMNEQIKFIIVTGNNRELYEKVLESYKDKIEEEIIELYGYHNEVYKLMDQSHLIITKPGGLTVSESIAKGLPLIVPFYIPGQEYENLMFLCLHGAALAVEHTETIPMIISHLKDNPLDYKRMQAGVSALKNQMQPKGILRLVRELIEPNE